MFVVKAILNLYKLIYCEHLFMYESKLIKKAKKHLYNYYKRIKRKSSLQFVCWIREKFLVKI